MLEHFNANTTELINRKIEGYFDAGIMPPPSLQNPVSAEEYQEHILSKVSAGVLAVDDPRAVDVYRAMIDRVGGAHFIYQVCPADLQEVVILVLNEFARKSAPEYLN